MFIEIDRSHGGGLQPEFCVVTSSVLIKFGPSLITSPLCQVDN